MSDVTKHRAADAELLARYRDKHGHPYMPLSLARKMRRLEMKYAHLEACDAKRRANVFPANAPEV